MDQLRDRMVADLRFRNLKPSTEASYLNCIRSFTVFFGRCPSTLGKEEVRDFLEHLLWDRGMRPSGLKGFVAALKFLYTHTLERPEVVAWMPWPKINSKLPEILDPAEVRQLFLATDCPLFRAFFVTIYATGLRVSEACLLRIKDLDSRRGVILIRGKGGRDRYVPLHKKLLGVLRRYYLWRRPKGPWLFPRLGSDRHITDRMARANLHKAVAKTSITKKVTPHVLRHSCATHLLEAGVELRVIQALLGHASISTTTRYTRVSTKLMKRAVDPLDLIEKPKDEKPD